MNFTRKPVNLIGRRFGMLVVTGEAERVGIRQAPRWMCHCDCGNDKAVGAAELVSGKTRSCSCLRRKMTGERHMTHGDNRVGRRTPLYKIWAGMLRRCYNKNEERYPRYGGRGIIVCERWHDYVNFKADMQAGYQPGLSIERKDNSGNYEPSNCVWATRKEQCRNRTTSHFLEFDGHRKTIAEWAEILKLKPERIAARVAAGWPTPRVLTAPLRHWPCHLSNAELLTAK